MPRLEKLLFYRKNLYEHHKKKNYLLKKIKGSFNLTKKDFTLQNKLIKKKKVTLYIKKVYSAPTTINLEMTEACNVKCRHCYNPWREEHAGKFNLR